MPRPKALPESHRECRTCKARLDLNADNFSPSRTCRKGFMLDCRQCWREAKRLTAKLDQRGIALRRPAKNMGANCGECFGLPWQVVGATCVGCGLKHALEPRPELVLWRSWAYAYV